MLDPQKLWSWAEESGLQLVARVDDVEGGDRRTLHGPIRKQAHMVSSGQWVATDAISDGQVTAHVQSLVDH